MVGEDSVTVCHITGVCSYDGAGDGDGDVLMLVRTHVERN